MIDYHAQKVDDFGAITGTGLGNLLGAPSADNIETLLREAMQNSWDARLSDDGIGFDVEGVTLRPDEEQYLWSEVLSPAPPQVKLCPAGTRVLVVRDRRTRGLAGPVRASEPADDNGRRDFVNFVYMVGETKPLEEDGTVSGGTYGYGRSSFFRASSSRTVLIHTKCKNPEGNIESRFIALAWTAKYEKDSVQYTGRHWWGHKHEDEWVGPVLGQPADEIMSRLGIEIPDGTGTTITVIDPCFDLGEDEVAGEAESENLANAIVRNCWPKILTGEVDISLRWERKPVPIPNPAKEPRLRLFTRAFRALHFNEDQLGAKQFPIWIYRPKAHLGELNLARDAYVGGPDEANGPLDNVCGNGPTRHIALMRNNLLIVKYLEVSEPLEGEQYAGVFITDREIEPIFAHSEPPSHDDWVIKRLDKSKQTFVRVAFRRIESAAREFVKPKPSLVPQAGAAPLAALSQRLGSLLPATQAPNEVSSVKGKGGLRIRTPAVTILNSYSSEDGEQIVREVAFEVEHVEPSVGTVVSVSLDVLTEGGRLERDAPEGEHGPKLLGWEIEQARFVGASGLQHTLQLNKPSSRGSVAFSQPRDCMVQIRLETDVVEGE